jgi:hypothetical protein
VQFLNLKNVCPQPMLKNLLLRLRPLRYKSGLLSLYSSAPITPIPCLRFVLFVVSTLVWVCRVVVRWLGSSFAFFVGLCVLTKNANVLPKALAILLIPFYKLVCFIFFNCKVVFEKFFYSF